MPGLFYVRHSIDVLAGLWYQELVSPPPPRSCLGLLLRFGFNIPAACRLSSRLSHSCRRSFRDGRQHGNNVRLSGFEPRTSVSWDIGITTIQPLGRGGNTFVSLKTQRGCNVPGHNTISNNAKIGSFSHNPPRWSRVTTSLTCLVSLSWLLCSNPLPAATGTTSRSGWSCSSPGNVILRMYHILYQASSAQYVLCM